MSDHEHIVGRLAPCQHFCTAAAAPESNAKPRLNIVCNLAAGKPKHSADATAIAKVKRNRGGCWRSFRRAATALQSRSSTAGAGIYNALAGLGLAEVDAIADQRRREGLPQRRTLPSA